jgi:hypothetical protein
MFRRHFIGAARRRRVPRRAAVQAQQIIKATDVHPLGYPTVEAIVRMGNKLEKATNGASRCRCTRRCSSAARRR